jgi:hypothetical protein
VSDQDIPTNTGGHAFPACNGTGFVPGMTLRDYFAAKAMAAILTHRDIRDSIPSEAVAAEAYGYADAMIAHRD